MSQLFAISGLEEAHIGDNHQLANNMGLFLQKTNIIRDYLEDSLQNREFWPKEVRENNKYQFLYKCLKNICKKFKIPTAFGLALQILPNLYIFSILYLKIANSHQIDINLRLVLH